MASVIDSFRETFSDRFSFFKLVTLAIPAYYSYEVYLNSKKNYDWFFFIAGLTVFFLFGFLISVTSNVINDKDTVLPSLNPFKLAFTSFKGLLALTPTTIIAVLLANYACSKINILPWLDITFKIIIWLVMSAIILTAFLMYTQKEKISDAYNLKFLFEKSGDLITAIIFFLIQLILINLLTGGFIGYTLFILFGFGHIFDFFCSLLLIFNIAVTGHYMAQVHYELFYDKKD